MRTWFDGGSTSPARPGPLVVPQLDRLIRPVPDARTIGDDLAGRGIKLPPGGQVYDPEDPMGKMSPASTQQNTEAGMPRHRRARVTAARDLLAVRGTWPVVPAGVTRRVLARCASTAGLAGACLAVLAGVATAGTPAWQFEHVPKPPHTSSYLNAVSCPARGECIAVGASPSLLGMGNSSPLAARWNGTSWAAQHVPPGKGVTNSFLYGVSCPSPTNCTAVGWNSSGGTLPLAEQWDGTAWHPTSVPLPAGAVQGGLNAVSCPAPDNCTGAGWYMPARTLRLPLVEHWNGASWSVEHVPFVKYANGSLGGVSCPTTAYCVATGSWSTLSQNTALFAERWNGTRWSFQNLPLPAGSTFALLSVSCWRAGHCTAVGGSANGTGQLASIVERMTGTSWALQTDAAPAQTALYGIACPSGRACTAVGDTTQHGMARRTGVAEHWNGATWTSQALPLPPRSTGAELYGVSCLASSYCTAAGIYGHGPAGSPLADHEG